MATESTVMRRVWMELAQRRSAPATLFRSNSGKAWLSGAGPAQRLETGAVLVPAARPVGLGLCLLDGSTVPGLGDLTGYTLVTVTPDMVGRVIPVFTGIETKASGGGRKRDNQIDFMRQLHRIGAIGGFAASVEQAHEIIDAWLRGEAPVPL